MNNNNFNNNYKKYKSDFCNLSLAVGDGKYHSH